MKLKKIYNQVIKEYFEDDIDASGEEVGVGDDGFWGSRGAGVLPICRGTGRILIALRSSNVMEPGTWGVWGGAIDGHETSTKEAAMREFKEETQYDGSMNLIDAYVFKKGDFQYFNYIGLLPEEFEPSLDWENDGCKWVSFEEMCKMKNLHFGLQALIKNSKDIITKYCI